MSATLTDSLPSSTSSGSGLLPPSLSASSFGRPTSSFKKEEEQRKKERTLSGGEGTGMGMGGFDPTKAFGERRGSRSASSGSAGEAGGREAVRKAEAAGGAGAGEKMGSVFEEDQPPPVSWTPPPIVQAQAQAQDQDQDQSQSQSQQQQQHQHQQHPQQQQQQTPPPPIAPVSNAPHFALTPGLDAIPFSDSFAKALEEKRVATENAST